MYTISRLWKSPTITQYGKQFSTLGSFLLIMPLVLSNYDEKDIAIWFLITTVVMFSSVLSQRTSITFMRVVSFAFAGAKDYSPITNTKIKRGLGLPNWDGIRDINTSLSRVYLIVSLISTVVAGILLSLGIINIVDGQLYNYHIVIVLILVFSTLLVQNFVKYNVLLLGCNEIALINRWNTLFGLIGIVASVIILYLDGNIVYLVGFQQFILVASGIRDKILFRKFLKKRGVSEKGSFDRNIIEQVKEPFLKGLVSQFSQMGMVYFSGVLFTFYEDSDAIAAYLFSLRLLTLTAEFSQIPFTSLNPYFAKLRSQGNIRLLSNIFSTRISISLLLYSVGTLSIYYLGNFILTIIDSNVDLVDSNIWLIMLTLYGLERTNIFYLSVLASSNVIILYKEQIISSLISLLLIFLFIDLYGIFAIIFSIWIPRILLFNVRPMVEASKSLNKTVFDFGSRSMWPLCLLISFLVFQSLF